MNKPFEQKEGDGALFKNEDRESEQHPLYKGSIRIGGQDYWLSAWLKESKAGKKYMSLSARPKQGATKNPPAQASDDFDDDSKLPF